MMKLLDLFCCQGGAGMGYHRAGFEVTGRSSRRSGPMAGYDAPAPRRQDVGFI
jgi:site-specific DNA-cytosine methylase